MKIEAILKASGKGLDFLTKLRLTTENEALEAVKQNSDALRYVNTSIFNK